MKTVNKILVSSIVGCISLFSMQANAQNWGNNEYNNHEHHNRHHYNEQYANNYNNNQNYNYNHNNYGNQGYQNGYNQAPPPPPQGYYNNNGYANQGYYQQQPVYAQNSCNHPVYVAPPRYFRHHRMHRRFGIYLGF